MIKTRDVRVRLAKAQKVDSGGSRQLVDPFSDLYETNGLIEPPYPPEDFVRMTENSNILQPLIDAYKTNITGFGYNIAYAIDMDSQSIDDSIKIQAKKDWFELKKFYDNCNFDKTFIEITKQMIDTRERIGWGAIEVIPLPNGKPGSLEHIPAHTLRLTRTHPDAQKIPVLTIDSDGKRVTITYVKRFRRFCQVKDNDRIWFKEFGDPRKMDRYTGEFEEEYNDQGQLIKRKIPPENEATSILYFPIYCPYSPYGVPRWVGNILSITGSRKAEELNFNYFKRGKHVPMAVLVKNGSLTESSIDLLENYAAQLEGVENAYGYLVLEVGGFDEEGFEEGSNVQTDIKLQPLTETLQQDELFQQYDDSNRTKIRASFRLPPIYTGESKDYTRATADTARAIAEEQIFNPEREEIAHKFNQLVSQALGVRYAKMYFKSPSLSNKLELAKAIEIYNKTGVLTPNMLIQAVSDLLGIDFDLIPDDWGNKPMAMTLAEISKGVIITPGIGPGSGDTDPQDDEPKETSSEEDGDAFVQTDETLGGE